MLQKNVSSLLSGKPSTRRCAERKKKTAQFHGTAREIQSLPRAGTVARLWPPGPWKRVMNRGLSRALHAREVTVHSCLRGDEKAGWEQKKKEHTHTLKKKTKPKKRWFLTQQLRSELLAAGDVKHPGGSKGRTRETQDLVDRSVIWLGKSSELERAGGCKRTPKDASHKPALLFLLSVQLL